MSSMTSSNGRVEAALSRYIKDETVSDLGVYIHYPWCRSLCSYCDFPVTIARGEPPHEGYRDAVLAELDARAGDFAGRRLVSIYLGGGTPSLWRPDAIGAVIAAVAARFGATPGDLEITLEANPTDCTPERMAAWRAAGINRVSIGVQSLDPGELVVLGRDHRMGDGRPAIDAALAAGFRSVSADLIFGATARMPDVTALPAPHLSVYELTVEPRTALGRAVARGTLTTADDDARADLYAAVHASLEAAGFEHYEVSSYARPGHRAVHNSLYWRGADYLGLGVGAASFRRDAAGDGIRETNVRETPRYLRGDRQAEVAITPAAELAVDLLWLAMRTRDGAPLREIPPRTAERLLAEELCEITGPRLRPTLRGFLYNDRIARMIAATVGDAP
jgi:oxygen-independent coproporphyrinogen-3 oxidase